MRIQNILDELRGERARIEAAISALEGKGSKAGGGARRKISSGHRHMSKGARAKISAAKKAWWAKQKRKGTTTTD